MAKKILIIDDEKSVRKTLSIFFTSEGYEVITAADLEKARELIHEADLVLLDIRLGDGNNGIEFLEEIRRQGNDNSFLVMSGMQIGSEMVKALDLTGFPIIQKPISFGEILKIVKEIIAG